ncbi:MAG: hypothetical protein F6K00_23905 [Leptolyngbya sp. SIOISBB]|nr:hypothetical protein [Leptolyngbya sp. SIOISBB]
MVLPEQEAPAEQPSQVVEPTLAPSAQSVGEPAALLPTDVTPESATPPPQLPPGSYESPKLQ